GSNKHLNNNWFSTQGGSNEELKDDHNHLGEFGEADGSSLPFIEDDLDSGTSPDGVDLGGEDQPFDILQKSLLEADITEQTLAQEALLDSQPSLIPTATAFPQQLVSGGFGGVAGPGVVAPLAQPQAFIQQVPQLPIPNGPAGHIQVVGSFNGSASSMMTINSLEQSQILLRPSGNVVTNNSGQGTMFAPSAAGQVSMSFNKGTIPLQNFIIQRGPMQQTLIRPIQPKPLQTGGQTLYNISNIGLQPSTTTTANLVSSPYTASGSPQSAQQVKVVNPASSIVMHSPLGQQAQPQSQSNLSQGQFLLPTSISLTPGTTVHGFQAVNGQVLQTNTQVGDQSSLSTTTYSILTNQNTTVQLIAGQNFSTGGQLIVNQGSPTPVVQMSQRPGATAKVWTASSSPNPTPVQTSQASGHLTMVSSGIQGPQVCQQLSVTPGQHLLMPMAQNIPATSGLNFQQPLLQPVKTLTPVGQEWPLTPKRPATQQLTRGEMVLQQLRRDHSGVMSSERTRFTSFNDVIDRLLPYHVFQGSPPRDEGFTEVDEEFEAVAVQVLSRTQAMVNKYRRLLMRSSPSSEMVMIDRTFNQEERGNLTQDKRMILVDPGKRWKASINKFNQNCTNVLCLIGCMFVMFRYIALSDGFLEDFCCGTKLKIQSAEVLTPASHEGNPSVMETSPRHSISHTGRDGQGMNSHREPAYRTEPQQQGMEEHRRTPIKCILDLKKKKSINLISSNSQHAHYPTSPSQSQHSSQHLSDHSHAPLADTDSVLEAAVNSILEC
uniref:BICRA like chromatin remodeling complex associated protein n=1 Tax=Sinocyclocheilus grahami TaxID=75366 RepID=A0A672M9P7_SINGR